MPRSSTVEMVVVKCFAARNASEQPTARITGCFVPGLVAVTVIVMGGVTVNGGKQFVNSTSLLTRIMTYCALALL